MRSPRVLYKALKPYAINRVSPCGYLHSDGTLYSTLDEALKSDPSQDGLTICRVFNDESEVVAQSYGSEWNLDFNCDSTKVAQFMLPENLDRIPSLNKEYTIKSFRGKSSQKTLSGYGRRFKEYLRTQCINSGELLGLVAFWDQVHWASQETGSFKYYLQVDMIFYILPDNVFNRRDTTNMIKIVEDSLADVWGINDARHVRFGVTEKRESDQGHEFLQVRVQLLRTERS